MFEIERKFSVKSTTFLANAKKSYTITQGYLNSNENRTVRVRIKGDKGFITVKGISSADGLKRFEWEKEIAVEEAEALLLLCEDFIIDKTRYIVLNGDAVFEVDVFEGLNTGLVIAEIELQTTDEHFEKPDWLGDELTGDKRFYNSYLSNHPFANWVD